jgi:ABC-type branched-subunit amino acid transport system ATPase component
MLELKQLSCGYGAFQAVHELSLTVRPGTITGLLGPNGAGKSSTLMCMAGHVPHQAGRVLFDGQDISELPPTERGSGLFAERALGVADDICVLESGKTVWSGSADHARNDPTLASAFLGLH